MLNGVLMAADEATVPATDRALTHGLGLYETLKLVGGVPVFFEEHIARLDLGLEELGLERPAAREEMAEQICRLSEASDVPDGACRVLVTAGPPDGTPGLIIQTDKRRVPGAAAARDQLSRRPRARPAQGDDRDAVVSRAARRHGRRRRRRDPRRRRGPHVRGRDLQHVPGARRRPRDAAGRGRHPPRRAARQGRGARDRQRHPRGRGVRARRRPAPGRRHAAHEQRARHRARRQRGRARSARARRAAGATASRSSARRRRRAPPPSAPATASRRRFLPLVRRGFTARRGAGTTTP